MHYPTIVVPRMNRQHPLNPSLDSIEITVRPGEVSDGEFAWRVFQSHLNWINVSCGLDQVIQRRLSADYTNQVFRQYPSAAALVDDKIVGFAITERRELGVLEIVNFYVDDVYRGRGVGSKLLEAVEAQCRERGFHTVVSFASTLYYDGKQLPENLFRRLGYIVTDLTRNTQMYIRQVEVVNPDLEREINLRQSIVRSVTRLDGSDDDDLIAASTPRRRITV